MSIVEQLDPSALDAPLCGVVRAREVDQGPHEGAILMFNKPIVGIAISNEALFLFVDETAEEARHIILSAPKGFKTGNPEIDEKLKGIEPGEEWKNG